MATKREGGCLTAVRTQWCLGVGDQKHRVFKGSTGSKIENRLKNSEDNIMRGRVHKEGGKAAQKAWLGPLGYVSSKIDL